MPLKFDQCAIPPSLKIQHRVMGGQDLVLYSAEISDGGTLTPQTMVRVMGAREPIDDTGKLKGHVTISIGPERGDPIRRPTDEECREALALFPSMVLIENNADLESNLVRNFWEN